MSTFEHARPARRRALAEARGTARSPHSSRQGSRGRGLLAILADLLLWTTAAAGVLFAVLAVLTMLLGFRVMLFATGSMEPTIPTGSAALVAPVDAAQVRVGDVVTVDRGEGNLPVTHRVVAVESADGPNERLLTLRGDANDENDPSPYEVDEVGRVIVSVPGVASTIAALGEPSMLVPLGAAASGFVVWGLWPRKREGSERR
ncbi:signal peptidase I [Brevibacterium aurantiacum]|uniref:Signal peptidase I n=2 Tax=Brevibacterium aurantiacum TaxID=273384 RepID=A0A556CE51_BREAU|nr:signal peptidase I [Brevibacterium aurantiacum]